MEFSVDKTVAFSGNRLLSSPATISQSGIEGELRKALELLLESLYQQGKRYFMVGGALGFDMLAAEEILALRVLHPDVQLLLAIPFEGQEAKYPAREKLRYVELVAKVDQIEVISGDGFSMAAYHERNEFMVQSASLLVAYSNGRGRGTLSTVRRAEKLGLSVINLYDEIGGKPQASQLTLDIYCCQAE